MNKISSRHKKKPISKSTRLADKLIRKMRKVVKEDSIVIKKFKEYGVSLDDIDTVHIEFADLDVSAKTKNRKIYLNKSMLSPNSQVKDPTSYLVHELTHYLQQTTGDMKGHSDNVDYLDKRTEQEAFKAQIEFKKKQDPDEAKKYTEDLLDHHDVRGKEREKKKNYFLNKK